MIGLNELRGWDETSIKEFARACGCSSGAIFAGSRSRYPIGLIAKSPVAVIEQRDEGFRHGVLHVKVGQVHFVVAHLTPKRAHERLAEASALLRMTGQVAEPLFLMGDLNALSPLDKPHHDDERLAKKLRSTDSLQAKFLRDDGTIDYDAMQMLLDSGFVDVTVPGGHTVPTKIVDDEMHAAPMRLDYILANQAAGELRPSGSIVADSENHDLSDHFPVECEW